MMHPRLYRLVETQQRIDDALRLERRNHPDDSFEVVRLNSLRLRAKQLIARMIRKPVRV